MASLEDSSDEDLGNIVQPIKEKKAGKQDFKSYIKLECGGNFYVLIVFYFY